jgi:hypothetical protein
MPPRRLPGTASGMQLQLEIEVAAEYRVKLLQASGWARARNAMYQVTHAGPGGDCGPVTSTVTVRDSEVRLQ